MKEKQEDIFDQIYNETYNYVLRFVISKCDNLDSVEDIMQDIYIKLHSIIKKDTSYITEYKSFLIKLARNELFKYYSLKNKLKLIMLGSINKDDNESSIINNIKDESLNIEKEIIEKYDTEAIWSEIKKEDITTQKIIALYFLEEQKIKEISNLLNMNESSVKTKLYRAINRIKESLGGE